MSAADDTRWDRADSLLQRALDLPTSERTALLDRECGNDHELRALVERLLASAESEDSWLTPGAAAINAASFEGPVPFEQEPDLSGTVIDRYRLVEEVGRGGMAVVYRAERADGDFDQQLALKLIKRGVDTDEVVARFMRERRILSRIRHPNIARFIDGGTTEDGRPYFAMELVEGQPIDRFCDERALSVNERLALVLDVARAVAHAHRNLVVHRDLKPSNVLVDTYAQVKLLDFGIARLLGLDETDPQLTRTRQRVLTPAYASPEQILGEPVTTASDVYQLGVLLYLLLTGRPPHAGAPDMNRLAEAITTERPDAPSTQAPVPMRSEIAGDLDVIVLMALRKEPERRYSSVEAFIKDIERYLRGHPVSARPDTWSYRTSKFIQRNRVAVSFAGVMLFVLVGFAATMAVQAARIAAERDRANVEAETAQQVSEFMVELFKLADPNESRGASVTVREVLDKGAQRLSTELGDQPAVKARLIATIGRVYQNLALYDRAEPLLKEALKMRRSPDANPGELIKSLNALGWLLEQRGDYSAAEPLYREALDFARQAYGEQNPGVAKSLNNLALVLHRKGKFEEAEPLHRQALEMRRRLYSEDDPEIADSLNNLALTVQRTGNLKEAEQLHREALRIRRATYGDPHARIAMSLDSLGRIKHAEKKSDEAEAFFQEALAMRRTLFGDEHPEVLASLNNLASVRFQRGDLAGAETLFREVVDVERRGVDAKHPGLGNVLNNLGIVLAKQKKFVEAASIYAEASDVLTAALEPGHWLLVANQTKYGECLLQLGRLDEAEPLLRAALKARLDAHGPEHKQSKKVSALLDKLNASRRP